MYTLLPFLDLRHRHLESELKIETHLAEAMTAISCCHWKYGNKLPCASPASQHSIPFYHIHSVGIFVVDVKTLLERLHSRTRRKKPDSSEWQSIFVFWRHSTPIISSRKYTRRLTVSLVLYSLHSTWRRICVLCSISPNIPLMTGWLSCWARKWMKMRVQQK